MRNLPLVLSLVFYSALSQAASLNVMSYNVENFFDTNHDEGKQDWTFLSVKNPEKEEQCKLSNPANSFYLQECLDTNWTNRRYKMKLSNIASVITSTVEKPDLLGLVEIENEKVVGDLAKKLGYKDFVTTNSPDERGIDVALIYKQSDILKFKSSKEHIISVPELTKPTRNLLEVNFEVRGSDQTYPLFIMVNHWPSQSAPHIVRLKVAEMVMGIIAEKMKEDPNTHVLLMGDFNVTDKDNPHAFTKGLFLGPNALWDVHGLFMKDNGIAPQVKNALPKGTYFYMSSMGWDLLDHFFISKNMTDGKGLDLRIDSYDIHRPKFLTQKYRYKDANYYTYGTVVNGVPKRFAHNAFFKSMMGFSDHFAIKAKIEVK